MPHRLPQLRKRIARTADNYSACWALVEQPSLLVHKEHDGRWQVFCDRVYIFSKDAELPGHVMQSLQIERDLSHPDYIFSTRRDALQAVQMWLTRAISKA